MRGRRRRDEQQAQQLVGEFGGVGARGEAEGQAGGAGGAQDRGHVRVEGEGLAAAVRGGGAVAARLQGRGDVRVHPEGPEGVVCVGERQRADFASTLFFISFPLFFLGGDVGFVGLWERREEGKKLT